MRHCRAIGSESIFLASICQSIITNQGLTLFTQSKPEFIADTDQIIVHDATFGNGKAVIGIIIIEIQIAGQMRERF